MVGESRRRALLLYLPVDNFHRNFLTWVPMRYSSIVLLSGGLDSLAAFHWAALETDLMLGVTFSYGQRSCQNEITAAQRICRAYEIKHQVVELSWFFSMKSSALIDHKTMLPRLEMEDLDNPDVVRRSASSVWVPNRNGVFLNVAACLAENMVAGSVVTGFNREEAATFQDNSKNYLKAVNESLKFSTQGKVVVQAPMIGKNKVEIVKWLLKEEVDLTNVWSCYEGGERMCGVCESCLRLRRALTENSSEYWLERLF
jgi:7-cyano-7-deazaguanine synthase